MRASLILLLLGFVAVAPGAEERGQRTSVIMAIGTGGEAGYTEAFAKWAGHWKQSCAAGGSALLQFGGGKDDGDVHQQLAKALADQPAQGNAPLWLVLLGHGTFDGREPKFNLPGNDLAVSELAEWLKRFQRPVVVICGFSASGAWLKPLSGHNRVILTATKSGSENNFARLGGFLSELVAAPSADLDKDGQTSLLEAWLAAAQKTADFYKNEDRLATEHSLLEDNGDGLATPPDWFRGVRVVKKVKGSAEPDGLRAHQIHLVPSSADKELSPDRRTQRDALELELSKLRDAKATMDEAEYYKKLEAILLKLARIYHAPPDS